MWDTLQNIHDTNSEIERERWWKDLFIVTPLRKNDGGHRNTSESSRRFFQNCKTNTSLILVIYLFFMTKSLNTL